MKKMLMLLCFLFSALSLFAQGEEALLQAVKARLDRVNDYTAQGTMKIDVPFINAPPSGVTIYFKKPNQFKVIKEGGISLLPKGGVSVNLGALLGAGSYTIVPAGTGTVNNRAVKVLKLIPMEEASDVILTTLYIDEKEKLVRKAIVTTKENGTYEMLLSYGKYAAWGLPDAVVFTFNTKDYKLPKGITFEYQGGKKPPASKEAKGKVALQYSAYKINKGVSDAVFRD